MAKWHIPPGASVLDLGAGSGVLGLAALHMGAKHLVALDINTQAVATTSLNLTDLGYAKSGEARLSDVYSALLEDEKFDVIIFAAPYWNRPAADDLERSCFDEDYSFFETAINQAHKWLVADGAMYVIFSDQGDVGRALKIIDSSGVKVEAMHLGRPTQPNGHIRIIWELRPRRVTESAARAA
jgi:methylase of polypeptide subunit release factors